MSFRETGAFFESSRNCCKSIKYLGDKLMATPPFLVFEGEPVEIGVGRAVGGTVGNDAYFNGIIDEVGMWNRGLNANEIEEVMTKGLPSPYSVNAHNKIATTLGKLKK